MSFIDTKLARVPLEINGKEAFDDMLFGNEKEPARGEYCVIQHLKKDSDGKFIKSMNSNMVTGESSLSERIPGATITGYLCDEYLTRTIKRPSTRLISDQRLSSTGYSILERNVALLSTDVPVSDGDRLILIEMDANGKIKEPITPKEDITITKVIPKYDYNGVVAFNMCLIEDQE